MKLNCIHMNGPTCLRKVLTSGRRFNFHPEQDVISPCSECTAAISANTNKILNASIFICASTLVPPSPGVTDLSH
jgi:hypothetical protein